MSETMTLFAITTCIIAMLAAWLCMRWRQGYTLRSQETLWGTVTAIALIAVLWMPNDDTMFPLRTVIYIIAATACMAFLGADPGPQGTPRTPMRTAMVWVIARKSRKRGAQ